MDSSKVKQLIDEAIAENPSLFLIDWKITPDDKIVILADGDEGLSVEDIVRISRYVEHNLDREECDFALEVSSPGVGSNLTMPRQFVKNIGRTLEATLNDKVMEGEIVEAPIPVASRMIAGVQVPIGLAKCVASSALRDFEKLFPDIDAMIF